jgi:hypothetical protein
MEIEGEFTRFDPLYLPSWYIDDMIVRLRLWGTDYLHPLPEPHASPGPLTLGSAASCEVRLHDKEGRLSREHAVLRAEATGWEIRDLDSKNGLFVAGARTDRAMLQPGVKVQLGGLTLVAESLKFIRLRSLVARLLGWAPSRQAVVDEALQNLRSCATERSRLILIGSGDLAPVALRLHRLTLGPDAPFVGDDGGDVRAVVSAATSGTLCIAIRDRARASELADAVNAVEVMTRPRLVMCASKPSEVAGLEAKPGQLAVVALPPLAARADEISRVIHEAASDLVKEIGAQSTGFTMHDLERLPTIKFTGMADLEDTIRRVIAMRIWGVTAGAKKLGLKHSSLSTWARSKDRRLST